VGSYRWGNENHQWMCFYSASRTEPSRRDGPRKEQAPSSKYTIDIKHRRDCEASDDGVTRELNMWRYLGQNENCTRTYSSKIYNEN
jgi:hypothetical protein